MKHVLLGLLLSLGLLTPASAAITTPLHQGDRGEAVSTLQSSLQTLGYFTDDVTGYFGSITASAVKHFQEAFAEIILTPLNLSTGTGFVGPNTASVLTSMLAAAGTKSTTGSILLKRTGADGYTASAPATTAGLTEASLVATNPLLLSALAPTAYTAYTSNVPGYTTTAGSCTYNLGRKECTVADTSFTLTPTCTSTLCALPTKVQAGKVTKVVVKYTLGSVIPTPSPTPTVTPTPTPTPTPLPTVTPYPTPTPVYPTGTILTPGSGFSALTPQPATVGTGPGSDAKAIARWDAVPFQTFDSTLNVGVVAFHINEIDHVAFSVNGGPWTNIYQMTLNPETNVSEYWVTLRAADFADGSVEVRAVAYPKVGVPRVLQGDIRTSGNGEYSLILHSNAHATFSSHIIWAATDGSDTSGNGTQTYPYRSLLTALLNSTPGDIIYLKPGIYAPSQRIVGFGLDSGKWTTVMPAPGLTRNDVTINISNSDDMRASWVHYKNVKLDMSSGNVLSGHGFWLDNVEIFGNYNGSAFLTFIQPNFADKVYITDSNIHDMPNTPTTAVEFQRNVSYHHTKVHGANDPRMFVNITIDDMQSNDPAEHNDGIFWYNAGVDTNDIAYNVSLNNVTGLLILSDRGLKNFAVVNLTGTAALDSVNGASQFGKQGGYQYPEWEGIFDHVVLDKVTLTNQRLYFVDDTTATTWSNSIMRNCVAVSVFASNPANQIRNCRTPDGTPIPDFGGSR